MITLKEALKLNKDEIKELRKNLAKKIKETKYLGAYVEQLTNEEINTNGEGIPIAIKDNIQVKGWSVTCASKILQGYVSPYDASVITNMAKANLSAFGRTNMDEFAMGSTTATSFYGKTLNPADNERVPGGSSGGSAAAVAGGIAIAALGSDTGGSIRQPAAFCGCVGLKPTYGKVSRYGLTAFSSSLDQIGPITQNVEDAAILFDIIAGHESKDSTSANISHVPTAPKLNPNRKLKIAVIENFLNEASEDIRKGIENAITALRSNGHEIVYKNMLNSKYDVAAYYVVATAEASANLSRFDGVRYGRRVEDKNLKEMYVKTRSEGFGDEVKRRILLGTFVLSSGYYDAYYIQAQKARHLIKNNYEQILKEADLILSPVTPTRAFKFGAISNPLEMYLSDIYTIGVNLCGVPAISVPVSNEGLPVGLQLTAKHYDEQTLLDGAFSLETILKGK
ncbi:MAG: Asp-tRNA(Asn)/Glu-tRNA(Gln) amidotransferase subunit GatA [Campylobacteraceae bacterium]|jgi:aspartyl-tRNA(Asn)/glutamyl-tRNA(Gln) amidotransferase subunit A|nr:Asp-tRNA(Asn)/Glu-tRNA(Gln) amidotransferase subunit GatA [Campylobacteraceae bacterium]